MTPYYQDARATLYEGDARVVLAELEPDSVDCVVTSPPYWSLRSYRGIDPLLYGGDPDCGHGEMEETAYQGSPSQEEYGGKTRWQHVAQEAQDKGIPVRDVEPGAWEAVPPSPTKFAVAGNTNGVYGGGLIDSGKVHARSEAPPPSAVCRLCGAWRGNLGQEPTPDMYIAHLMEYMDALWRVLKPTGTVWVNIDDSRVGSSKQSTNRHSLIPSHGRAGLRPTSLALIPDRFAIACQERGWIVESKIIWDKNNPMPESVKRRPTDGHEYIFLLAKSPKWRFYQDAVREPHQAESVKRYQRNSGYDKGLFETKQYAMKQGPRGHGVLKYDGVDKLLGGNGSGFVGHSGYLDANGEPLVDFEAGRNVRTVWRFPTRGSETEHPATYPEELVERCLQAGTQEGDVVLDPFAGSGTTLWVAKKMGRRGIGVELSQEYCDIAAERIRQQVLM